VQLKKKKKKIRHKKISYSYTIVKRIHVENLLKKRTKIRIAL